MFWGKVRHVDLLSGALASLLPTTVITRRCLDTSMASELTRSNNIGINIKELRDVGTPEVVRRNICNTNERRPAEQDM